jgi:hypothetical protein
VTLSKGDFGNDPVEIDVTASTLTVQITVEAVKDGVAPERRRFATIALPREEFMTALGAGLPRAGGKPQSKTRLRVVATRDG